MANLNKVMLIGRLTRDPELRTTPSGKSVAQIGLAIDDSYKNQAGEKVERACFVDIDVWGRQAETANQYLRKGSLVFIEGSLRLDQWENQQGEKRSKLKVTAQRIQFLDRATSSTGASSGGGASGGDAAPASPAAPAATTPPADVFKETEEDETPF